jgi:hypothetical protein
MSLTHTNHNGLSLEYYGAAVCVCVCVCIFVVITWEYIMDANPHQSLPLKTSS